MGEVNLFALASNTKGALSSDVLKISPSTKLDAVPPDSRGLLMVRPEYMRFAGGANSHDFTLTGTFHGEYALGSRIQYELKTPQGIVTVEKLREDRLRAREGDTVAVGFNADITHFIGYAT
jgi:spermidine/putrescine transport system ATP-binding protein